MHLYYRHPVLRRLCISHNPLRIRVLFCNVKIDESVFPDEIFRGYISESVDTDKDGLLLGIDDGEKIDGVYYPKGYRVLVKIDK